MTRRFLIGPVSGEFADQELYSLRAAGRCLTFGHSGGVDLDSTCQETWESLMGRLPPNWRPDFLILNLAYQTIAPALWSAPVPVVAFAADWNFTFHSLRRLLPYCDALFTDAPGATVLRAHGYERAWPAYMFGLQRDYLEEPASEGPRDIDVVFAANMHPAVQRERLAWLGRLAALAERWHVVIATNVHGHAYRSLLRRSRIAFNRSVRCECNRRAFEAAATGALLFQEAGNAEVAALFHDRRECVFYNDETLETLLEHYLTHEDERRTLAAAGQQVALSRSCTFFWEQMLAQIDQRWDALQTQAARRPTRHGTAALLARTEQALSSETHADHLLAEDVATAVTQHPEEAQLHNALGVALAALSQTRGVVTVSLAKKALPHLRQAVTTDPAQPLFALNLTEALVGLDQRDQATEQAQRTLTLLDRQAEWTMEQLDGGHFPPGFDLFRVEWERAAWSNAGQPRQEVRDKVALLRWRLHSLLADLTGKLGHHYEAVLARPDLPTCRAALGCALAQADHADTAVPHLHFAAAANPFDRAAARAYYQALIDSGDGSSARRWAYRQRLLQQAAPQLVQEERWFAQAAPVGTELASLVILCCNEVDYTRQCLDSVCRHTRVPYELILVDNGSTDDTPALLEEVRRRPGPERVVVVRNEVNRGFPAGCNQGLAEAKGRYLVFLNNDTIVTAGWLDGLITWALHDWPHIGLVGPVTNYAAPPQQIPVSCQRLDGLESFAAARRRDFAGKALTFERLSGFCLLARREVLNQVGTFDERFGLGFFDDDDLGLRVRKAGFKLLIAQDVFVHHFGSRTFTHLGIDCSRQLRDNLAQFQAKWGPEEAAHYRMPDSKDTAAPRPTVGNGTTAAPRVSLCLIVKNEEHNLPACLESVADLVEEIVVVDTGSTDQTKAIATRFGAKVVDFPWIDSFSAARNASLQHATGQWIFWMDADDHLDAANREKLRSLFATLQPGSAAYSMKCLCLPDPETGSATVVDHIRLFRNDPALRWEHRVHEQILPALRRVGADVRWADVVVHHAGYQDAALRKRKLQRDQRLLELERAELGDHPFTLFNLGSVYQELGRHADALTVLRRSLERSHPSDSIVRKLYALIVSCHRAQGQQAEAWAACQEGRQVYPDDAELLFAEALMRRDQQDLDGAAASLQQLLTSKPGTHFASVDAGLRGYKARQNLGVIYRQQGKLAEAEREWQAVLAEQPDFVPAWLALGELYLGQRRWPELEVAAQRLDAQPRGHLEAAVLAARAELARQDFAAARQRLEATIRDSPQALWPQVILSHVLLQQGRDLAAAEQALRAVLKLDPQNAEARNNLKVLLCQRQREAADTVFAQSAVDDA